MVKETNKTMYVWRVAEREDGDGVYTVATDTLSPQDTRNWHDAKKDKTVQTALVAGIQSRYLTAYKGDICVSAYPNYEECMSAIARTGHDIRWDYNPTPTFN